MHGKYNWDFSFTKSRLKHDSMIVPLTQITNKKGCSGLVIFVYESGEIQI